MKLNFIIYMFIILKNFLLSKTKNFLDWNRHYFHSQAIYESLDSINSVYIIYSNPTLMHLSFNYH